MNRRSALFAAPLVLADLLFRYPGGGNVRDPISRGPSSSDQPVRIPTCEEDPTRICDGVPRQRPVKG